MSDELYFYLALIAIYLIESCKNVNVREIFVLKGFVGGVVFSTSTFLKGDKSLNLFIPPFLAYPFRCESESAAFSPEGLCNVNPQDFPFKIDPALKRPRFIKWEDVKTLKAEGLSILVNGKKFIDCVSPRQARCYCSLFESLRKPDLVGKERARIIDKYYESRCDSKKILAAFGKFKSRLNVAVYCALLHFFCIYILMPAVFYFYPTGLLFCLDLLAAFLLTLVLALVICLSHVGSFRAKLIFYIKSIFMFPFMSLFIRDFYVEKFSEFCPLATLAALNRDKRAFEFVNRFARSLEYTSFYSAFGESEIACVKYSNKRRVFYLIKLLRELGADDSFCGLREISNLNGDTLAYCPKCKSEFVAPTSRCPDCGCEDMINVGRGGR